VNATMYQLTRAIAHASGLGVCHRDVHPANVMIHVPSLKTELTGWNVGPSASSRPYMAPELFLSPECVIMEHMKGDVWSLGMVLIEALKGSPLVKMDPNEPLAVHCVVGRLFKTLGSPSEMALKALDPTAGNYVLDRIIQPQPWWKLLRGCRADPECTHLLDRMLDWNPATREPAASLLCFPYFETSRAESCKSKAVTQFAPTAAEIEGLISVALAASARRAAVEREVASWMSSHEPHRPRESESRPPGIWGMERLRRRPPISERRRFFSDVRLLTIHEDPLAEVAY
jgi:serine/threonine protein kinase